MRVIKMAQAQRLRKDRPGVYLILEGEPPLGQKLYIYAGIPLIACINATKDGIYNSMLLDVQVGFANIPALHAAGIKDYVLAPEIHVYISPADNKICCLM